MEKKVRGFGINDSDYFVTRHAKINGKKTVVWICPFYQKWSSLIERCYNRITSETSTYSRSTVSMEWELFSSFKKWMQSQDWEGKDLDKDILYAGNTIYSPDKCVFVDPLLNNFIVEANSLRKGTLIGTTWDKNNKKFIGQCCDPFKERRSSFLGRFPTEIQAHLAWKSRKRELAIQLANSEYVTDERVAQALINRYQGDGVYIDAVNNNVPVDEFSANREQYLPML